MQGTGGALGELGGWRRGGLRRGLGERAVYHCLGAAAVGARSTLARTADGRPRRLCSQPRGPQTTTASSTPPTPRTLPSASSRLEARPAQQEPGPRLLYGVVLDKRYLFGLLVKLGALAATLLTTLLAFRHNMDATAGSTSCGLTPAHQAALQTFATSTRPAPGL